VNISSIVESGEMIRVTVGDGDLASVYVYNKYKFDSLASLEAEITKHVLLSKNKSDKKIARFGKLMAEFNDVGK